MGRGWLGSYYEGTGWAEGYWVLTLCCSSQSSLSFIEPGPAEKQEDTVHPAQTPRACYLVLGPGMGWQLVAMQLGLRLLLLMLSPQTPTHGLRSLATHTLQALTPLL